MINLDSMTPEQLDEIIDWRKRFSCVTRLGESLFPLKGKTSRRFPFTHATRKLITLAYIRRYKWTPEDGDSKWMRIYRRTYNSLPLCAQYPHKSLMGEEKSLDSNEKSG